MNNRLKHSTSSNSSICGSQQNLDSGLSASKQPNLRCCPTRSLLQINMNKQCMIICCLFVLWCVPVNGQVKFSTTPHNVSTRPGTSVTLQCSIADPNGQIVKVQWAKDGLLMGYERTLPGYDRYELRGTDTKRHFNLHITDVRISDDGVYDCQVMSGSSQPLRAQALLQVIVPPSAITLQPSHQDGAVIEIKEHNVLEVECQALTARPAAVLHWKYDGKTLGGSQVSCNSFASAGQSAQSKLLTSSCLLRVNVTREQQLGVFMCVAEHPTYDDVTLNKQPISAQYTNFTVSVLYNAGQPIISGYEPGQKLVAGARLALKCKVPDGNPKPEVYWYRSGSNTGPIDDDYSHERSISPGGAHTVNTYSFTVDQMDNMAVYKCVSVTQTPSVGGKFPDQHSSIALDVHFSPLSVSISGAASASQSEQVLLECSSAVANPAAAIHWIVDGRPVSSKDYTQTSTVLDNGYVSVSKLNLQVPANQRRDLLITCSAHVSTLPAAHRVTQSHNLIVYYPTESVVIEGGSVNEPLLEGSEQTLTCRATGGNPLPALEWTHGRQVLTAVSTVQERQSASELRIRVNRTHNQAVWKCSARSAASRKPITNQTVFTVYFAPSKLEMWTMPNGSSLVAGQRVSLVCAVSVCNPMPLVHWYRNGQLLTGGLSALNTSGSFGGWETTHKLSVDLQAEDDGATFTCKAAKPDIWPHELAQSMQLIVLYRPQFSEWSQTSGELGEQDSDYEWQRLVSLMQHESTTLDVTAKGNPASVQYRWFREVDNVKEPLANGWNGRSIHIAGSLLNISNVTAADAGRYICVASNTHGNSSLLITLTVKFAARIESVSAPVQGRAGQSVEITCKADGIPFTANSLTWQRSQFDFSTVSVSRSSDLRQIWLRVPQLDESSAGQFMCVAHNNLSSSPDTRPVHVLIQQTPTIQHEQRLRESGCTLHESCELHCVVRAVPAVVWTWTRSALVDAPAIVNSSLYTITNTHIDLQHYTSTLTISRVSEDFYNDGFDCEAANTLGSDKLSVQIVNKRAPTVPSLLTVHNVSADSFVLSWLPAFDGGSKQSFSARLLKVDSSGEPIKNADVLEIDIPAADQEFYKRPIGDGALGVEYFRVDGLEANTAYSVQLAAHNAIGTTGYTQLAVTHLHTQAHDANGAPVSHHNNSESGRYPFTDEMPWEVVLLICVVAALALLANICLVLCFVRRHKRRKLQAAQRVISASNQSARRVALNSPMLLVHEKAKCARSVPVSSHGPGGMSQTAQHRRLSQGQGLPVNVYGERAESRHTGHTDCTQTSGNGNGNEGTHYQTYAPYDTLTDDQHSIRTVIEVDANGQPLYVERMSPNTQQTWLVDDPNLALAQADYYAELEYAEILRQNAMQKQMMMNNGGTYAQFAYPEPPLQDYDNDYGEQQAHYEESLPESLTALRSTGHGPQTYVPATGPHYATVMPRGSIPRARLSPDNYGTLSDQQASSTTMSGKNTTNSILSNPSVLSPVQTAVLANGQVSSASSAYGCVRPVSTTNTTGYGTTTGYCTANGYGNSSTPLTSTAGGMGVGVLSTFSQNNNYNNANNTNNHNNNGSTPSSQKHVEFLDVDELTGDLV